MRNEQYRESGFTLIELLVALFLTGIITLAALQFFTSMNEQSIVHLEMAEIQQLNRACLEDISGSLRSAGYNMSGGNAYAVNGDSLLTFSGNNGSVDTVLYFIDEYNNDEYGDVGIVPGSGMTLYKLMKQRNSDEPQLFADQITELRFTMITAKLVAVTLEISSMWRDENYELDNGYRSFSNTERVVVRNAN